jgi:hypothetical protein
MVRRFYRGSLTRAWIAAILATTLASATLADGVDQVRRMEIRHFAKSCRKIELGNGYLKQFDFNNDGLTDIITEPDQAICDGVKAPECNLLGCPYRFYVQMDDGSYALIAEMQFYSYSTYQRYGNQVLVAVMQGPYCGRSTAQTCKITYRIRDTNVIELKRE